ncbi:MAG: TetR/AcrR family transcriptional regulator [SAR324 cluster bacterium]|nr:TetR/AcrR family transcriptional regulator [SAR324 cluster bacterium]
MKTLNHSKYLALPQRQKKFAKTKIALLQAFTKELTTKNLASIFIKDLCLEAEVSEPTFYNYFTSKQHILLYYIQVWSIEMGILAHSLEAKQSSNLQVIRDIFTTTYKDMVANPQITLEVIAFEASTRESVRPHEITLAEKWLYFPKDDAVEKILGMGLKGLLPPLIKKAVDSGELPRDTDQKLLFLLLCSLFFGTSLILIKNNPDKLPELIASELDFIFSKVQG